MSVRRKPVVFVAAAAAMALALSACGSSDDDDKATGSPSSSTSATGDTGGAKETFKIGAIGTYSGPLASSIGPAKPALEAWAKTVNDAGGINGHKIELFIEDDAGNPTTAVAGAKKLVEQDHVIALVGQASAAFSGLPDYLDSKKIPVIGGSDVGDPYASDANWFPVGGSALPAQAGLAKLFADQGLKSMTFLGCTESPACAYYKDIFQKASKDYGLTYPNATLLSSSLPDYSAICLTLKSAGVQGLTLGFAAATQIKIMEDCAKQGYKPVLGGNGNALSVDFLTSAPMDGLTATHQAFPFSDDSTPATKAFQAALVKYAPANTKDGIATSSYSALSWEAGKMFEKVATLAKLGNGATSADVYKGLYMIKDETLDGLIPPTTYVEGKVTAVNCFFVQQIKSGKFVEPQGLKPTCLG